MLVGYCTVSGRVQLVLKILVCRESRDLFSHFTLSVIRDVRGVDELIAVLLRDSTICTTGSGAPGGSTSHGRIVCRSARKGRRKFLGLTYTYIRSLLMPTVIRCSGVSDGSTYHRQELLSSSWSFLLHSYYCEHSPAAEQCTMTMSPDRLENSTGELDTLKSKSSKLLIS